MSCSSEKSPGFPLLVTAAIVVRDGRVLLTKRPEDKRHPGMWEFPGGKVDPGESPEEALRRELKEELDVEARVERIFEVVHYCYEWGAVLILAYSCSLLSGPIKNIGVAEHRWVPPAELLKFEILPADHPIVERLSR
jgi:8-oxo-dGTP diphosphatase